MFGIVFLEWVDEEIGEILEVIVLMNGWYVDINDIDGM